MVFDHTDMSCLIMTLKEWSYDIFEHDTHHANTCSCDPRLAVIIFVHKQLSTCITYHQLIQLQRIETTVQDTYRQGEVVKEGEG